MWGSLELKYCILCQKWLLEKNTRSGNGERVYELLKIPGLAFDSTDQVEGEVLARKKNINR